MRKFLFLLLCVSLHAQKLMLHDWPDTSFSSGATDHLYRFCDASSPFSDAGAIQPGVTAAPMTVTGTVTYAQPGYDPTSSNNCSATFTPGSYATTSSATPGDYNWNQPFTAQIFIKNLQLPDPGDNSKRPLICKAVGGCQNLQFIFGCSACNGWAVTLVAGSGFTGLEYAQNANASSIAAGGGQAAFTVDFGVNLLQGQDYQITLVNPGDGVPANITAKVNGIAIPNNTQTITNTGGMGGVLSTTITNGGTGYSSDFLVAFSGGGSHCRYPTATAHETGGVVTSVTQTGFTYGCVSTITASFAAGSGTGAAGTVAINPAVLNNSGTLTVGDASNVWTSGTVGFSGAAVYSGALTDQEIQQQFASTDYYRSVLPAKPANPLPITEDNDICADVDSFVSFVLLQRLHQLGYVKLLGYTDTELSDYAPMVAQLYLSRGGMYHIPVLEQSSPDGGPTTCQHIPGAVTDAPITLRSTYPPSTAFYRQTLANATSPITMIFAGPTTSLANLITSPADGISSLTGRQLIAAHVGAIYQFGGGYPSSGAPEPNFADDIRATVQEFDLTTGLPFSSVPLYLAGDQLGQQIIIQPGTYNIYPPSSILYQEWCIGVAGTTCTPTPGTDTRQGWDTLPVLELVAPALFTQVGPGTNTINASNGNNSFSTSGTTNNQFYATSALADSLPAESLILSLLWTDTAFHQIR